MIGKILLLPFWIISKLLGSVCGVFKLGGMIIFGVFKFIVSHLIGTVFGAIVGLLLGKEHVGVRLFTHTKKHHA